MLLLLFLQVTVLAAFTSGSPRPRARPSGPWTPPPSGAMRAAWKTSRYCAMHQVLLLMQYCTVHCTLRTLYGTVYVVFTAISSQNVALKESLVLLRSRQYKEKCFNCCRCPDLGSFLLRLVQWSPTEAEVFASCGVDGHICIWDARAEGGARGTAALRVKAHDADVNVISWNRCAVGTPGVHMRAGTV